MPFKPNDPKTREIASKGAKAKNRKYPENIIENGYVRRATLGQGNFKIMLGQNFFQIA